MPPFTSLSLVVVLFIPWPCGLESSECPLTHLSPLPPIPCRPPGPVDFSFLGVFLILEEGREWRERVFIVYLVLHFGLGESSCCIPRSREVGRFCVPGCSERSRPRTAWVGSGRQRWGSHLMLFFLSPPSLISHHLQYTASRLLGKVPSPSH